MWKKVLGTFNTNTAGSRPQHPCAQDSAQKSLPRNKIAVLPQPSYNQDISPADIFLFQNWKYVYKYINVKQWRKYKKRNTVHNPSSSNSYMRCWKKQKLCDHINAAKIKMFNRSYMVNSVLFNWDEIFLKNPYSVSSGIKRVSKPNFLLVRSMTQTSIYTVK